MKKLLLFNLFFVVFFFSRLHAQRPADINNVYISFYQTVLVVFDAPIQDFDRGSSDILAKIVSKNKHVIKIKANRENFKPTTLSVFTDDGAIYSIRVFFVDDAPSLEYRIKAQGKFEGAGLTKPDTASALLNTVRKNADTISSFKKMACHAKARNNGMKINLRGVYIDNGILYFHVTLANQSNIPYIIDYSKTYQRDKSKAKRTSVLEQEIYPLYQLLTPGDIISNKSGQTWILTFPQFTIADSKFMTIDLFEKNGDRHLQLKIKGKDILKAKPLFP
ncbi:conjugative transposon protein TraN [Chitinophaga silvisoli]|uniref:Conjugative transposon protein TraN n=1 Tax=Chitinophaga silvisoli TaxID=2291814 RepID=A0A3E1P2M6_9BACT|nr:conjugative transposon protein TraN [Chitinophaga silvisoli]RFM34422.1 conjugative transposon protein TraN [Chitinophaga silvisoli]